MFCVIHAFIVDLGLHTQSTRVRHREPSGIEGDALDRSGGIEWQGVALTLPDSGVSTMSGMSGCCT